MTNSAPAAPHCTKGDILRQELSQILTEGNQTESNKRLLSRGLGTLMGMGNDKAGAFFNEVLQMVPSGRLQRFFEDTLLQSWAEFGERAYPEAKARMDYYFGAWVMAPSKEVSGLEDKARKLALLAAGAIPNLEARRSALAQLRADFANAV